MNEEETNKLIDELIDEAIQDVVDDLLQIEFDLDCCLFGKQNDDDAVDVYIQRLSRHCKR